MKTSRITALLCLIGAGLPSLAMAQYGFDEIPDSTFYHHHDWRHYGTDSVPNTMKHLDGLAITFGVDPIPGVIRQRTDQHPHHELIHATIQHLTAAIEYTPGSRKSKTSPKSLWAPKSTESRPRAR